MTTPPQTPVDPGPKGPQLDEVLDSLMGWNRSFLRTMKDGFLKPEKVAGAVLAQDHNTYASPLRLMVFLFSIYMALTVFMLGGQIMNAASFSPAEPEVLESWLNEQGLELDSINAALEFWFNLLMWPITIIASSPYAFLFKAFAPSRTLYGAVLVYITTINTMTAGQIILTLVLALFMDRMDSVIISLPIMLVFYFYISARVISTHYSSSLTGTVLKVLSIVLLTPVTLILTVALQVLLFDQVIEHRFDLDLISFMNLRGDTAP